MIKTVMKKDWLQKKTKAYVKARFYLLASWQVLGLQVLPKSPEMGVNCARCSEDLSHTLQGVLILYSLEASSAPDKFSKPRRQPQPGQE